MEQKHDDLSEPGRLAIFAISVALVTAAVPPYGSGGRIARLVLLLATATSGMRKRRQPPFFAPWWSPDPRSGLTSSLLRRAVSLAAVFVLFMPAH